MSTKTATKLPTMDDFAAVVTYGGAASFSPDGSQLAVINNRSGQYNIWLQPVDGGEQTQLTFYTDNAVRDLAWSPDGTQILYTADYQGNEKHQLFLMPADGGKAEALTDAPEVQYFLGESPWSPNGELIAYAGNDRDPYAQDIIIREAPTGEVDHAVADGRVNFAGSWSPDGTYLLIADGRSNLEILPKLLNAQTGELEDLGSEDDLANDQPAAWAPDGSGFWMITDRNSEHDWLGFFDLESRQVTPVSQPDWSVEMVTVSKNGKWLVWSVNEDGYSRIQVLNRETNEQKEIAELPGGTLPPFGGGIYLSPDNTTMVVKMVTPTKPNELYVVDLETGKTRQLTDSRKVVIDESLLIEPEQVEIAAFDGLTIPALLFKPQGEGPFPAVLSIHGGPEAQERPGYTYRGFYQFLLSRGIAVLAPNIRGSTGYGKSYQKLIHGDLGGNDVKDFEACAQYLQSLPWVKPDKIGVYGGSYGGFAVLTCVSRLPDYWAAAVDIVGPSNLVTLVRTFPPTWRDIAKGTFGDPDTQEEDMLRRSPITYVDQIKAPLYVIQGANDPRVVQAESDAIVEKLRARGVDVKYDIYPDEGHGFTKVENDIKAMCDSGQFFIDHLTS
jgi:dipeptidyl aminopeptidase/acylaminoacyl peptidase